VEASTEPGPAVTKRVFITGGGGDLARAMISGFSRAGWWVDAPTHQQLDVTDRVAIDSWIARSPGCDLLVHNAGLRLDRRWLISGCARVSSTCRSTAATGLIW
jgi:NAD(P)-dependent dehydrogenase (short-subunit alcohol dehydrogenase family)